MSSLQANYSSETATGADIEEKSNVQAGSLPDFASPDSSKYSDEEWKLRVELAAAYRLIAQGNMDDAIFTHLSLRLPRETPTFLINPYGMIFDEITASSLVEVDVNGHKVCNSPWPVNPAGFDIHAAVHTRAPNAHCVIHTHSLAGMTVAAMPEGLLWLNQMALHFYNRIGRYSYDTIHFPKEEQDRLVQCLGSSPALIMENHGMLTCGPTVGEAFFYMYYLEKACQIQANVMAKGEPVLHISESVCEEGAALFHDRPEQKRYMWAAFVRKLLRESPSFAE